MNELESKIKTEMENLPTGKAISWKVGENPITQSPQKFDQVVRWLLEYERITMVSDPHTESGSGHDFYDAIVFIKN